MNAILRIKTNKVNLWTSYFWPRYLWSLDYTFILLLCQPKVYLVGLGIFNRPGPGQIMRRRVPDHTGNTGLTEPDHK